MGRSVIVALVFSLFVLAPHVSGAQVVQLPAQAGSAARDNQASLFAGDELERRPEGQRSAYASGDANCSVLPGHTGSLSTAVPSSAAGRIGMQTIPAPESNAGVWLDFEGARYHSDGIAVSYDSTRFLPVGNYRGFPVFREMSGGERIFVTIVADGPIAPFAHR